jgi:hypothetical protein
MNGEPKFRVGDLVQFSNRAAVVKTRTFTKRKIWGYKLFFVGDVIQNNMHTFYEYELARIPEPCR